MANFKKRIKELRIENNLTQLGLAKKLGISKSTISMYENGNREPNFEILEALADIFNVDIDYLHGRTDIPKKIHFDSHGNKYQYTDQVDLSNISNIVNDSMASYTTEELQLIYAYRNDPILRETVDRLIAYQQQNDSSPEIEVDDYESEIEEHIINEPEIDDYEPEL